MDLLSENEQIINVFLLVRNQTVQEKMGEGKIITDLGIPAIKIVMDIFEVQNQKNCLLAVRKLWHELRKMGYEN